jgi:hypothetical protein
MLVTIMYRNNWFGGDGWTYYPVTVEISDNCPVCGQKRGEPKENRYCEDGEFFYLHNWTNPCGHVDYYKQVYEEAQKLKEQKSLSL